jgi:transposase
MSSPSGMISARKLRRLIRTFLDESGILTNMTRRYARAPVGERACGEAPVRWKRLTVLGALSLDGVVTMTTVTTGTTIPVFVDFLQTSLLPVLREQKPDAILVMDNLSAHKNQAVKDAITAAGLTLRYLPRYSPDFSPIEPCWSKIKTALRAVAARTVESLRDALDTAVAEVTAHDAAGWFGHCGYTPPS